MRLSGVTAGTAARRAARLAEKKLGEARLGIALGVFSYVLFSVHDASIKYLVESLPIWQVLFFRSATIMVICLAIGRTRLLARAVASPVRGALLMRAALTLAAWMFYFTASRHLPLAQMTALYYAAPVMVTLMAAPLLGERITPARGLSVGLGFAGVLLASDPAGMQASLPALMVLIAAAFWGYGVILMRRIARRESTMLQLLVINIFFTLGTGAACAVSWVPMSWGQLALIGLIVVFGGLAQFIMFEAARIAAASVMATVEYTGLVWAFVLGFLIWGELPAPQVVGGAALILAAGTLLVMTERRGA
jgi:drug/metabolite transporter (DMT)-like permease